MQSGKGDRHNQRRGFLKEDCLIEGMKRKRVVVTEGGMMLIRKWQSVEEVLHKLYDESLRVPKHM